MDKTIPDEARKEILEMIKKYDGKGVYISRIRVIRDQKAEVENVILYLDYETNQ